MTFIFEILLVLFCCGGCFIVYAECCDCDCCEREIPNKEDTGLQISTTATSPIQECHVEI